MKDGEGATLGNEARPVSSTNEASSRYSYVHQYQSKIQDSGRVWSRWSSRDARDERRRELTSQMNVIDNVFGFLRC